jgi:glycosyltransferase involved in cell wall biosynthesis
VWFPSFYEGFGLPLLEAMACGTPVIASNTTSIPEVADNSAILVSPKSVTEHVEAVDAPLKKPGQREELSHRGKVRAQQFKWTDTVARLKHLFLSLV